jgi:signal transduction histidine kinase
VNVRTVAPTVMDVAVGAVVGGLGALQLVIGDGGAPPAAIAAVAVTAVALVWRRTAPIAVAVVCLAAFGAIVASIDEPGLALAGPIVALYGVGQLVQYRVALTVAGLCGLAAIVLVASDTDSSADIITGALLVVVALAGGQAAASRQAFAAALEGRLDALRVAQDLEVERRVLEDRLRLAHELHDVVAHSITVVNLQANVALRHVKGNEPAQEAIGSIRLASAQALTELRTMVGVLRSGDEQVPVASPRSIVELVRSLGTTALDIRSSIDEEALDHVPPTLLLAAHRVVQEGLTNVLRHSAAHHADVALSVDGATLVVQVHDPGPVSPRPTTVGGNGIAGLRERVALLGGTLDHGPDDDGGFTLRASIPLRRPA